MALHCYTTKHRKAETSVFTGRDVAILSLGDSALETNIHLNADDCRALAALLTQAAETISTAQAAREVA